MVIIEPTCLLADEERSRKKRKHRKEKYLAEVREDDNATDVIWQYIDGVAQFSPIADGRISEVVPSDETKEAVKQALEGVDYSDGALFFIQRSAAAKNNIQWFDKNLKKLFKHGVHEFYTYPEAAQQ